MVKHALWKSILLGALSVTIHAACSGNTVGRSGGETNWLASCSDNKDCHGATKCLCSLCTAECGASTACASEATTACATSDTPAYAAACTEGPALTGACLPKCPTGGCNGNKTCIDGFCVPPPLRSLTDAGDGSAPVVGPPYAYFYANDVDYGHIYAVPKGAGTSVVLAAGAAPDDIGGAFAFDDGHVYYTSTNAATSNVQPSLIALPNTGGGQAVTLVSRLPYSVRAIAVDATALYFLDVTTTSTSTGTTETTVVGKVSLAGGDPADAGSFQTLVEDQGVAGTAITTYGNDVYWTEGPRDDTLFVQGAEGFVKRTPKAGGPIETLARNLINPIGIGVDASGTYWLDNGNHPAVEGACGLPSSLDYLATGNALPVVVASGATSFVLKDGTVYFLDWGPGCSNPLGPGAGSLSKMPSPSGPVQTLAQHLNQPAGLFVDATDVYFTVVTDGLRYTLAPSMLPR